MARTRTPKVPMTWGTRQAIVRDNEYPLIFIHDQGRGGYWRAYTITVDQYDRITKLEAVPNSYASTLERARKEVQEYIGTSIQLHVMALHSGARLTHLLRHGAYPCGAPTAFKSAKMEEVTCLVCVAAVEAEVKAATARLKGEALDQIRQHVEIVNTLNALGQTVDGGEKVPF